MVPDRVRRYVINPSHARITDQSVMYSRIGSFSTSTSTFAYPFDPVFPPHDIGQTARELIMSTVGVHEPSHLFDVYNTPRGIDQFLHGPWGWVNMMRFCWGLQSIHRMNAKLTLPLRNSNGEGLEEFDRSFTTMELRSLFMNGFPTTKHTREVFLRHLLYAECAPNTPIHELRKRRKEVLRQCESAHGFATWVLQFLDEVFYPDGDAGRRSSHPNAVAPVFPLHGDVSAVLGVRVITEAAALIRQLLSLSPKPMESLIWLMADCSQNEPFQSWSHAAAFGIVGDLTNAGWALDQILAVLDLCMWGERTRTTSLSECWPGPRLAAILKVAPELQTELAASELVKGICKKLGWQVPDERLIRRDIDTMLGLQRRYFSGDRDQEIIPRVLNRVIEQTGRLRELRMEKGIGHTSTAQGWRAAMDEILPGKLIVCESERGERLALYANRSLIPQAPMLRVLDFDEFPELGSEVRMWGQYWMLQNLFFQMYTQPEAKCPAARVSPSYLCGETDVEGCTLKAAVRENRPCLLGQIASSLGLHHTLAA